MLAARERMAGGSVLAGGQAGRGAAGGGAARSVSHRQPQHPGGSHPGGGRLKVIQVLAEMGPKNAGANEVLRLLAKLEGQEPFREIRKAARATRGAAKAVTRARPPLFPYTNLALPGGREPGPSKPNDLHGRSSLLAQ